MTEKENFDDLIRQKLSEEEFPFDEKNWEKAAGMIDASRGPAKKPMGYFVFSALLIVSLCVVIPMLYNNDTPALADNNTSAKTNSNSSENANNPKPEITNNGVPTSVATNFDNQDAKPNSETSNNTSITSNENTSTNETAITKQEPRQPKKETQSGVNSVPNVDAGKINTTAKAQTAIKAPTKVKKSEGSSSVTMTKAKTAKADNTSKPKGNDIANTVATRNAKIDISLNKKAAAEKAAADKANADKIALDKANADKAAADKATADKIAIEKAAEEKALADKLALEKAAEVKAIADKLAADKAAEEKAITDKLAADKAAEEKAAADKLAADDKKKDDAKNTPPSKNVFWAEAGGNYLLGWNNNGTKDANGFNFIGGLNFTRLFTSKIGISIGAQYNSISNIKTAVYTAQKTTYEFGDVRDVTTVSTQKLHYLTAPVKLHFVINNNNTIGAGVNIAYLINSKSSVETYTQRLNTKTNTKVETSPGYYNGFASPDMQLSVFYKRRICKNFGVNAEFIYGLSDVKNDAFFNSAEAKQKTTGFKLTLTYDLFKK